MSKINSQRLMTIITAFIMLIICITAGLPVRLTANAVSADYPAELVRISTYDNSRNLNITGYSDNSALNTWTTNGQQNENWRFDYVGANSVGSYFKITNMGTGRLITPLSYNVSEGSSCVIYGSESATSQHWYVIAVSQDSYGNDLHYKIVNYDNPDLAITYNSSANTVSLATYSGADSQKWLLNTAGLQGFAGYAKDPNGNVKASAIGGLLGEVVEVTTFDELKTACSDATPRTIVITKDISKTGTYTTDSNGRYRFNDAGIYMYPNKTIIGSYSANSLYNVYFRTYEGNYGQGKNIIIRNIEISHDKELNNDNIWEFSYGSNFWIDHCTFIGHDKINGASTGLDDWDKFLNFKGTTDFVTISDCKFGLHEYGVLLGYPTDTQETYNTYNGRPCVTLADNYYNNCITRAPALMRYGYFHSMNNYVVNFDMGYTIYTACKLYSENNYFDGGTGKGSVVNDGTSTSDISSTYPGVYTDSGSVLVNSNYSLVAKNAKACSWRPSSNYSYTAKTASDAKAYCTSYSGAQSSRSNMTYAMYAEAGVPSAGYVEAPTEKPVEVTPINGNLITNLVINDSSTFTSWSIDSSVAMGDLLYGDRADAFYASIPDMLIGAEAIVTSCDAKNFSSDLASFTASADMTVYVAIDVRVATLPEWLASWQKTGMSITNSKDVTFAVYSRCVRSGETVTLGKNGQSSGCVNYIVLAQTYKGDVNADSKFNVADLVMHQLYLLDSGTLTDWKFGDLNNDNSVDVFDMVLMRKLLVNSFPGGITDSGDPVVTTTATTATTTTTTTTTTTANSYEPSGFSFSGKVYLVGDSTVCNYDSNTATAYNRYGWGMKLADEYNNVTVNNLALSGRSSRSFLTEANYTTLCNNIGSGDYLFIQFGHNDEKTDEATYPGLGTYPGLDMNSLDGNGMNSSGQYSYEWILLNKYIRMAQNKGAVAVLVTPITRRGSDGTANYAQHTPYQQALISLGQQYNVPVIDMTTLTTQLYTNLYNSGGASETAKLHCYSDTAQTQIDNTHLSNAGAVKIASMIADQTKNLGLSIGNYLK